MNAVSSAMKIIIPSTKHEWTHLIFSALTGAVVATGVIAMLVSDKVGAIQLAKWQIAVIYVAIVAASALLGVKEITKT